MRYMVDRTINFDHFVSSQVICVLDSLNLPKIKELLAHPLFTQHY